MSRLRLPVLVSCLLAFGSFATAQEEEAVADEAAILALIEDLGAQSWDVRRESTQSLVDIGEPAIPYLQSASAHSDPEVQRRVGEILRILTEEPKTYLQRILVSRLGEDLHRRVVEQPVSINVSSLSIPAFASLLQAIGQVRIESSEAVRRSGAVISLSGESRSLCEALEESLAPHGIVFTEKDGALYLAMSDEILTDPATVGMLVETLASSDADVRRRAHSLLRLLTPCRLAFPAADSAQERAGPLEGWRKWYAENGSKLRWNAERKRFLIVD